jgi:hypothetical protein
MTKQTIWRGTTTPSVSNNPQTQGKNIDKAAQRIFARFPLRNVPPIRSDKLRFQHDVA